MSAETLQVGADDGSGNASDWDRYEAEMRAEARPLSPSGEIWLAQDVGAQRLQRLARTSFSGIDPSVRTDRIALRRPTLHETLQLGRMGIVN